MPDRMAGVAISVRNREVLQSKDASGELFFLDDEQWSAIAVHLPMRQRGPKRLDDRIVISGILQVLQSGCAWRDCPREYGPYMTVFNRYLRWQKRGIWDAILNELLHNDQLRKLSLRIRPTQGSAANRIHGFDYMTAGSHNPASRTVSNVASITRSNKSEPLGDPSNTFVKAERALATSEVGALVRASDSNSPDTMVAKIVEWYLRKMQLARPGLGQNGGPGASELETRVRSVITLLSGDYLDVKTRLAAALECIGIYANGQADGGRAAKEALDLLLPRGRS